MRRDTRRHTVVSRVSCVVVCRVIVTHATPLHDTPRLVDGCRRASPHAHAAAPRPQGEDLARPVVHHQQTNTPPLHALRRSAKEERGWKRGLRRRRGRQGVRDPDAHARLHAGHQGRRAPLERKWVNGLRHYIVSWLSSRPSRQRAPDRDVRGTVTDFKMR
jgi:hypothetical protein